MDKYNLYVEKRILGVLGGKDVSGAMFKLWAQSAHILVAADSGADFALDQGIRPHAIVGDMDSVSASALESGIDLYRIDDQNHTDCDKLLDLIHRWGHEAVTLIGIEGDRLDHVLATLHSCAKSPVRVRLAVRDGVGHVLEPGKFRIPTVPGRRISFFPLHEARGVSATGLMWPLNDTILTIGNAISVSNLTEGESCDVEFESGSLLVLQEVPHERLPLWPDQDGLAILDS